MVELGELLAGITPDNLPDESFDDAPRAGTAVMLPDCGDLVWIDVTPQAGHEQAGRRPALVLSPRAYHQRVPFAVVCPITSNAKGYPFEVRLPEGLPIGGAVLADQVKSLDLRVRRIDPAGVAPADVVQQVLAKLVPLLGLRI